MREQEKIHSGVCISAGFGDLYFPRRKKKLFLESEQLEGSLLRGETGWSGPGGAALWAPGLVTAGQEEPKATSSSFTGNSQASGRACGVRAGGRLSPPACIPHCHGVKQELPVVTHSH